MTHPATSDLARLVGFGEMPIRNGHGVVCAFNPGVVSAFNPGVICAFNAFWAHRHDDGLDDLGDRG